MSSLPMFVLVFSLLVAVHGGRNVPNPKFHSVDVNSLVPSDNCSAPSSGSNLGSQKLEVRSRYGPCSRTNHHKRTDASSPSLPGDKARVSAIQSKSSQTSTIQGTGYQSPATQRPFTSFGQYTTTISLGTPKQDYTVMIDTGSDYTWVRCQPCIAGCQSNDPLFDPSNSMSFLNQPCRFNSDDTGFHSSYMDNSYSRGYWGCDTLTLEQSDEFTGFQFGCGLDNKDDHGNFADAAGMLGLGKGDLSLVSQTAGKYGRVFGYCLPVTSSSVGYIHFGDRAKAEISSAGLKFTPLLEASFSFPFLGNYQTNSYYFLGLLGMSVAGTMLDVPSDVFTSPATMIDSGTVISRLPEPVYSALRSAFRQSMSRYQLVEGEEELLDTCYNVEGYTNVDLPEVVLHFSGADVALQPAGIVWTSQGNSYVWCLGFAPNKDFDGLTIIGSNQQRGLDVLYDLEQGRLGFGSRNCG